MGIYLLTGVKLDFYVQKQLDFECAYYVLKGTFTATKKD